MDHDPVNELIVGYLPAFRGQYDWEQVYRHQRVDRHGKAFRRVIFENKTNRHQRLLVDVTETLKAEQTQRHLETVLLDSNVPLAPGRSPWPLTSLVYPEKDPWSAYFTRANLLIWVFSCGRQPVAAYPWVERILKELVRTKNEEGDPGVILKKEGELEYAPGALHLSYSLRWARSESAWLQFEAENGTLERTKEDGGLLAYPTGDIKELRVTAWAMEPGREMYRGEYPASE